MNTNTIRFGWFLKIFASLCLDETNLSIGRVKTLLDPDQVIFIAQNVNPYAAVG